MRKPASLIGMCLAFAACTSESHFPPIGGGGSDPAFVESRVDQLRPKMTLQDVGGIIGMPIANYDDPAEAGHVCFSHRYGSSAEPKYIHSVFLGGNLQSATDDHDTICGPADFSG